MRTKKKVKKGEKKKNKHETTRRGARFDGDDGDGEMTVKCAQKVT